MLSYFFYKLGELLARMLPLPTAYWVADRFADIDWLLNRKRTRTVDLNLRQLFGDTKSSKEIAKLRVQIFRNFARFITDFYLLPWVNKEYIQKNVIIEGLEIVNKAQQKQHGIIFLTAHLGNWELAGAVVSLLGFPLNVVTLDHPAARVTDYFNQRRTQKGMRVIRLKNASLQTFTALKKRKECVALLGDRDFTGQGATVTFLGKKTKVPKGPAQLALLTQASIIPVFNIRVTGNKYKLQFLSPIEVKYHDNKDTAIKINTQLCIQQIEKYIRRYPEQWFLFDPL